MIAEFHPDEFFGLKSLIVALPRSGQLEQASEILSDVEQSLTSFHRDSLTAIHNRWFASHLGFQIALAEGRLSEATEIADAFAQQGRHLDAGILFLSLDEDLAREQLFLAKETVVGETWLSPFYLALVPDQYRTHPSILSFLEGIGLTTQWQAEVCRKAVVFTESFRLSCDDQL